MQKKKTSAAVRTLAIDIGGTGIKSVVLAGNGKPVTERLRVATPQPATPGAIFKAIAQIAKDSGRFDRVGAGFPGVVKSGVVKTAPHLHKTWIGIHLDKKLAHLLHKPARVANDAVVQGYPAITGKGVELVITLGTSMGSAIYVDGHPVPMEMGHHPLRHGHAYEDEVGNEVLERIGRKKWNKHVKRVIEQLDATFNYDRLYIGGGNAKKISFKLAKNIHIVDNSDGLYGVMSLWRD
jgi:polyphosphate glucokinase